LPRTKDQYDEIRSATRRKIQAAGLKLFSHKGFAATSISDIATLAGISTGLMYRHYTSKEDLFSELVNNAVQAMHQITQLLDVGGSPAAAIQNLTHMLIDTLAQSDETGQYFVLIIQYFLSGNAPQESSENQYEDLLLFDRMAKLIEKGQQLGEFKKGNPLQMAMFYFSSIQGIGIS
jgi:AcrR family transcriptional regulator